MAEGKLDISPSKIYVGKADVRAGKARPEDIGRVKNVAVAQRAATALQELYGGIKSGEKRQKQIDSLLEASKRVGRGVDPFHAIAAKDVHHEALSERDWLTGFLNEEAFIAQLEETFQKTVSVGVGAADLDKFSWLNDTLGGHNMGNLYLQLIAKLIRKITAQTDIFARGGDEFMFIINSNLKSEQDFIGVVRRIHDALEGKQVLKETLRILRESSEKVQLKGGKMEYRRTAAFRPIAQKILDLYDDVLVDEEKNVHAKQSFRENMRGHTSTKEKFLKNIDDIELDTIAKLRNYVRDTRLTTEMGKERNDRIKFEKDFSFLIYHLIPQMGISIAATYVDNPKNFDAIDIKHRLDQTVYRVKEKGGNKLAMVSA